jgi:hypothetical protein
MIFAIRYDDAPDPSIVETFPMAIAQSAFPRPDRAGAPASPKSFTLRSFPRMPNSTAFGREPSSRL